MLRLPRSSLSSVLARPPSPLPRLRHPSGFRGCQRAFSAVWQACTIHVLQSYTGQLAQSQSVQACSRQGLTLGEETMQLDRTRAACLTDTAHHAEKQQTCTSTCKHASGIQASAAHSKHTHCTHDIRPGARHKNMRTAQAHTHSTACTVRHAAQQSTACTHLRSSTLVTSSLCVTLEPPLSLLN